MYTTRASLAQKDETYKYYLFRREVLVEGTSKLIGVYTKFGKKILMKAHTSAKEGLVFG